MTTAQFLAQLRQSGIQVWVDDQQLRVRATQQQLTTEWREELRARKPEILAFLSSLPRLASGTCAIPLAIREGPLPLAFAQERLWFLAEYEPTSTAYVIQMASRLTGELDVPALERSLAELLRRHEVLRTTFPSQDGKPYQHIAAAGNFELSVIDLAGQPEHARETAAQRLLAERCQRVFDLAKGPLFDALLLRLDARQHRLLLRVHHVVFDGWSVGVLQRELSELYAALHAGRVPALAPLPVQYADFAVWQRQWLQGEELARQTAYWRECLRNAPVLELPLDRPRPAAVTYAGARLGFRLPRDLAERLRAFNQGAEATPFMSLLAAFNVLLSRYSEAEDIVVGTPIANRSRPELEGMLGFFVNTLAIRCDLSGAPSFQELAGRMRRTALDAFQHQDLPFEKLVAELNPVREPNRHPLFQVMLAVQNTPVSPLVLDGLETVPFAPPVATAHMDLELHLRPEGGEWRGEWVYNTDLFDRTTMERMAGHFLVLLESLLLHPDQPVARAGILTPAERQQLVAWNQTARAYPREQCVHELFAAQVLRTPGAAAVEHAGQTLTYQELNAQAQQLGRRLRHAGVAPGTRVAVSLDRSPAWVIACLAILKAGGAYVPLDPDDPVARQQFILQDTAAPVLVTQETRRAQFAALGVQLLCLDGPDGGPVAVSGTLGHAAATDPAYVIYTSGSTGQPKGVVVSHRAINRLVCQADYVALDPGDRMAQMANPAFDAATFELWGPLLHGGTVVILPREIILSPQDLAAALRQQRITTLFITTALFNQVVREVPTAFAPVRDVLFGGEASDPQTVRTVLQQGPPRRLLHVYGPTEVTTFTTWYQVEAVGAAATSVPIGRPIGNTTVHVLDARMQPVPVGVPGELYAGGDGVALEYLHQPQLTAERFVPDPFRPGEGARLYRTGDRVRWQADGNLEFLARMDQQVKLRGFRIELGEIETRLASHPAVAACAVLAQTDGHGEKSLSAFLVVRDAAEPPAENLRAWLAEKLPDYMIPARFAVLKALPLTPNGKLDRRALARLDTTSLAVSKEYVAPRTELEHQLARLWQQAFGRERIGVRDNFFDLGGHSLQAVRLSAEIDKLFGRKLPIAVMFQAPTIELLARWLVEKDWAPQSRSLVPLQPSGNQPPLFLVHGWGGDVYGYLDLVRQLPPDQPVYGLQAVGVDGKEERHITVEAMAASYVKEILSFQPTGSYALGGYSMGGVIAYEVARQLTQQGRQVALLALLDSMPVGKIPWFAYARVMVPVFWDRVCFHLRRWWQMPLPARLTYLHGRWTALQIRLHRNRAKAPLVTAPPKPDSEPPKVPGFEDYYHAIAIAYLVQPYPGPVVVFTSDEAKPEVRVWQYLAQGGAAFHRIPGNHREIMYSPDHVPVLAQALTGVLHRAQRKAGGPITKP